MEVEMSTEARITTLVEDAQAQVARLTFEPLSFLNECQDLLREACSQRGEWDSAGPNHLDSRGSYSVAADLLSQLGFSWAAEQLLIGWWNDAGERQLYASKHLYRAHSAYKLTQLYLRDNDRGAALRWALLTQADDLLSEHGEGGGAGKQWLRLTLGMTDSELNEFSTIADGNLKKAREANSPKTTWFDEDLVVQLALKGISFGHLFSEPSAIREFPISQPYLRALLDQLDADHDCTKAKGDALEDLASYLFLLIPGWLPRKNVLDEDEGFETDIIVSNLSQASNLAGELLGRHFLVECKNWESSVGVRDVGYFLHRMRLTHCNFGVMFAKENITGRSSKGETAARSLIRRAFHEDGNTCIVLDRKDLDDLTQGNTTLWSMLLSKIELFRFGKAKQIDSM